MAETHELAVMCDTFHPPADEAGKALDDGYYAYSWYTEDGVPLPYDADPAGATSHFCETRQSG